MTSIRSFLAGSILGLGLLSGVSAPAVAGSDLTVRVEGLRSNLGDVHVAVYRNPESFPKRGQYNVMAQAPVDGRRAVWVFSDLEPGTYAIAVYHDENNNMVFDQGFLGVPLEDFGFSNDATVFLGPPSFESAAFEVTINGTEIVISLGNEEQAAIPFEDTNN